MMQVLPDELSSLLEHPCLFIIILFVSQILYINTIFLKSNDHGHSNHQIVFFLSKTTIYLHGIEVNSDINIQLTVKKDYQFKF